MQGRAAPAMEPTLPGLSAGSDAGPGLGQVTTDEQNVGEHGSAERVGLNLSPYNRYKWQRPTANAGQRYLSAINR